MRVTFFGSDGFLQPMLDRRLIQFTAGPENPVPPVAFIQDGPGALQAGSTCKYAGSGSNSKPRLR